MRCSKSAPHPPLPLGERGNNQASPDTIAHSVYHCIFNFIFNTPLIHLDPTLGNHTAPDADFTRKNVCVFVGV